MTGPATYDFDVLMMTDCRFPGGNSSSVFEEVVAQTRAGYRTGILHAPSPVLRRPRPFSPKIRRLIESGTAELVVGRSKVSTRLLLARHPTIFSDPSPELPLVEADQVVLAVNQVPEDDRGAVPYYDIGGVAANIERMFGRPAIWSPIGPRVRDALVGSEGLVPISDADWENVIDVAEWHVERCGFVGDRPVIGRHSRGHWSKWPDTVDDILDAYPDDPRYVVSVLGGVEAPKRILGSLPTNWVDHPFDSMPATRFLAEIDFFVYFHHPGLIEAFGRVVLEAMSAGAVCIVPPYLRRLFGDVCLYGEPGDVRGYVDRYHGDWDGFDERSRRGIALARDRFSYETHVGRLEGLIGGPSVSPAPARVDHRPTVVQRAGRDLTLVVDLTTIARGRDRHELTRSVGHLPDVVVVETASDDRSGCDRVELLPRAVRELSERDRTWYVGKRLVELVSAHRPRHLVVVADDATQVIDTTRGLGGTELTVSAVVPGAGGGSPASLPSSVLDGVPRGWSVVAIAEADTAEREDPAGSSVAVRQRTSAQRVRGALVSRFERLKPRLVPMVRRARAMRARLRRVAVRIVGRPGVSTDDGPSTRWPASGTCTHPRPAELPGVLVVVAADDGRAREVIAAAAVRQAVFSSFQPYFLVPPALEAFAHEHRFICETLLTERQWAVMHQDGWHEYLRGRVGRARRSFGTSAVVVATDSNAHEVGAMCEAAVR